MLSDFPYAVTTSAIYQSQAPPGWTLADSTDSYRLWKRTAKTPPIQQLAEEARPGRIFRCKKPKFRNYVNQGGQALTWQPRTVIAKRLYWKAGATGGTLGEGGVTAAKSAPLDNNLAPGETASQRIVLPSGRWELSLQYVSPDGFKLLPTAAACGLFVDHLIGVQQPSHSAQASYSTAQGTKAVGNSASKGK